VFSAGILGRLFWTGMRSLLAQFDGHEVLMATSGGERQTSQ
jgi:hypothetical protein